MNFLNKRTLKLFVVFIYSSFLLSFTLGAKTVYKKVPSSLIAKSDKPITICEWAPDGSVYFTSWNDLLVVWDSQTNKPVHVCSNFDSPIIELSFSSDGKYFLVVTEDNYVTICYTKNYAEVSRIKGSGKIPVKTAKMLNDSYSLTIPLDGKNLYNCFRLIMTGAFMSSKNEGHKKQIYSIDVNRANGYMLTSSKDKKVKLWDSSYKNLHTFNLYTYSNLPAVFSPNGETFVIPEANNLISLKNIYGDTLFEFRDSDTPINKIVYSPDSMQVAFPVKSGGIHVFDTDTGELIKKLDYPALRNEKFGLVTSLAYSADGNYIIGGTSTGYLIRWTLSGNVYIQSLAKTKETQKEIDEVIARLKATEIIEKADELPVMEAAADSESTAEQVSDKKNQQKAKKEKKKKNQSLVTIENKPDATLYFDAGYTIIPTDYFIGEFDADIGFQKSFKNLPLFAGADVKIGASIPKKDFPYVYFTESGEEKNAPWLYSANPFLSFGYEAYASNGIRITIGLCGGGSFRMLWNNSMKENVNSPLHCGFLGGIIAGIDIKWFTVRMSCVYDSMFGLQNSCSLGAAIKLYSKNKN